MLEATAYTTGPLNQYTAIERGEEASFEPVYDADGNQTLIRTSTGIWQVSYNAENRPVRFVNESAKTVVECTYDYMGRRHTRKVSVNGTVSSYLRYMYRGYLQIAAIDAVSGAFRWFLFWDPTQPEATRPLAIRKDGAWYAYGWDLTGNVTEVFGKAGYLRTAYTYTPYGEVTAEGDVTQPIQWSSEYSDDELGLVYYNYRHLNPHDGRWISRDPIAEQGGWNLFAFVKNNGVKSIDLLGLLAFISCARFSDLSMVCLISILDGLCVCPECKKIADKMYKAKSLDTLLEKGNELVKCAENQKNDTPVTLEIIGPIFTNFGENAGRGPIPADKPYRILPKKDGGPKNKGGNYHRGTPSPTDLNKGTPGTIYDSRYVNDRTAIRIHELGLSKGCITIGSRYVDSEGKEIPLVSKNAGEGYIEQLMKEHNECGGFYLEIKEVGDEYKPEELINVKNSYDGAVYTPNTAATILKIPIM